MGTWTNNDGLYIRYGADEATHTQGGSYGTGVAGMHVSEIRIPALTELGTTAAIQANSTIIPAGAIISKVEVIAETAATSAGGATLNIGLIRLDRTTEIDYDGIVAALVLTSIDAVGDVAELKQGSSGHGALVGTELANAGLVTANYNTAAYTAGELRVKIYWYKD